MSKYVDIISQDEVPHLQPPHISQTKLDEMEAEMLPHQRTARRKGIPSLGAGAIYPVDEDDIFIPPIPIPDYWERAWAMDVGWRKTAAMVAARDPDTDVHYMTHEYYQGESKPIEHSYGIKAMLPWPKLQGAIDPAAEGSGQDDGEKLRQQYEDLGFWLMPANNAVAAGLHHILVLMQTGRFKIFNTMVNTKTELRLYRRDEKGKIVKENDHLMDTMRYICNTDGLFTTQPREKAAQRGRRGGWGM